MPNFEDELKKALGELDEDISKADKKMPDKMAEDASGGEEGEENPSGGGDASGDEKYNKSFTEDLEKSEGASSAFEVSDFLRSMSDTIGTHIGGLRKSVDENADELRKGLVKLAETIGKQNEKIAAQEGIIKSMSEKFENMPSAPRPKSATNVGGVADRFKAQETAKSSFGDLTKSQIANILADGVIDGKVADTAAVVFEHTGRLSDPGAVAYVRSKIGN